MFLLPAMMLMTTLDPPASRAADRPKPSPIAIAWEIEFKFVDLQRIEIKSRETGEMEIYWYMVYTATNLSDRAQHFFPMFKIVTEDLTATESDMGLDPLIFKAIKERYRKTYPYLVPPIKAIGNLMSGDDNARESVAIWPQIDLDVNNFSVFVAGLSGERRFMRNPQYDSSKPETVVVTDAAGQKRERTVNPKFFTLRKTLEIPYHLPGSPDTRGRSEPRRGQPRWIMR